MYTKVNRERSNESTILNKQHRSSMSHTNAFSILQIKKYVTVQQKDSLTREEKLNTSVCYHRGTLNYV